MLKLLLFAIGILAGISDGQLASSCHDLEPNACILFQKANPNLCSDQAFSFGACKRFCGNCPLECYMCPTPVLDPNVCNTTASCGVGQTCMIKHLTSQDGHHEYIMMCGEKDICEGASLGFQSPNVINSIIGKRSKMTEPDTDSLQRYERDVSISCCDTDFCNLPMTTTTSPPTSPGPFPYGCNRDIVFVLDDSGSVGSTNFRHALDFVKEIVRQLDIGPTKAQVAMLTFSTRTEISWYLNRYSTKQDLLAAVGSASYHGGVTHTNAALKVVREQVLTYAHGDRQMAKNVVIVLTDGQSNDKLDTIKEAQTLHSVSDDVISIAIGSGINAQEIQAIATDNHHVFDLRSYSALNTIFSNLMQIICNA
ncbi:collagen alpha-1(XII) chain-like [Mercenaria mercenaria]|uniref:collagen alpha-1(XII) chain-like n=1 Tax=Mercenaria mercenaria TaxID=6596 RepID=UPI00234F7CE3|nr:collagen alpha-1(XII) chain-like [Mercenaria mercenaria]